MVSSFTVFLNRLSCCMFNYSLLTQNNNADMKPVLHEMYYKREKHISLGITDLAGHSENMCAVNTKQWENTKQ